MMITATPATTPMTMAIVWCLGSSVAGSSAGEETRALSVKADHAVKRIFSLNLAFPLGLYCVLRRTRLSGVLSHSHPVCLTEPHCHAF